MSLARWTVAVVLLATPAAAHDFWLQPEAFQGPPGATTPLTLQVGDGPDRQRSTIALRRIVRFDVVAPDGRVRDARGDLTPGGPVADGAVRLDAPGVHVLALSTDAGGRSRLPADRFNAYVRDEGLTPALEHRVVNDQMRKDGSERYGRRAKALVQAGTGPQDAATRPVGLSLEIVPLVSPYARPRSETLPVQVLYEGRPLAGALVRMTDVAHDEAPAAAKRTDARGQASFAMPAAGAWRLSVVWTKPLGPDDDADFETTFSSLAFGLPVSTR